MNNTTVITNYAIYTKLLDQKVVDTRSELEEYKVALKQKQAAYDAALREKTAFEGGQDELINQCK